MIFKKCINPRCNTRIWLSESMLCLNCEKEANGIVQRIGQSRASVKSMSSNIDLFNGNFHVLPCFGELDQSEPQILMPAKAKIGENKI